MTRSFALGFAVMSLSLAACGLSDKVLPLNDPAWAKAELTASASVDATNAYQLATSLVLLDGITEDVCVKLPEGAKGLVREQDFDLDPAHVGGWDGTTCRDILLATSGDSAPDTAGGSEDADVVRVGFSNGLDGADRQEIAMDVTGAFGLRAVALPGDLVAGETAHLTWTPPTDALDLLGTVTAKPSGSSANENWNATSPAPGQIDVDVPAGTAAGTVALTIAPNVKAKTAGCTVATCAYEIIPASVSLNGNVAP